ncbi:hypothetical protein KUCAC02_033424 [Chaenocephalus aceratus]|nr:hypothetical protein KUCAC02_033424 [Chaenocephalus aceratus]
MAADWLESVVSINCGLTLGVYQGSVSSVDHRNQTISLKLPFHNGVRCSLPEVTFREEIFENTAALSNRARFPSKSKSMLSSVPPPKHSSSLVLGPPFLTIARDIKELKILDFQRTVSEPGSDPGSAAEPSLVPEERQGQPLHPHLHHQGTNSTAPLTILRRGGLRRPIGEQNDISL